MILDYKNQNAELIDVKPSRKRVTISYEDRGKEHKHSVKMSAYGTEVGILGRMLVQTEPTSASRKRLQRLNAYGIAGLHLSRDTEPRGKQQRKPGPPQVSRLAKVTYPSPKSASKSKSSTKT